MLLFFFFLEIDEVCSFFVFLCIYFIYFQCQLFPSGDFFLVQNKLVKVN